MIIPNFNYAEFVAAAVESALALDWPEVEIIVVDDGSDDESRDVIERYRDRVTIIHQRNSGQHAACNAGFARSRGDVVIFLDSDDLLHPSVLKEVAAVWRPGISKIQFQMMVIDRDGQPTGALLPQYNVPPTPRRIRQWVAAAATYPTPPGSGNVYARAYLEQIFPLSGDDRAADSYCLAAAPYFGDVVTVVKPLVSYRVHGRNDGAMDRIDVRRFAVELQRAQHRASFARTVARQRGMWFTERGLERNLVVLPYRLASLRLAPDRHPIAGDTTFKVLRDLLAACLVPQGRSGEERLALALWSLCATLAPARVTETVILWRFASSSRPRLLRNLLGRFRVVKRHGDHPRPPAGQE